jgi:hypothetical protein
MLFFIEPTNNRGEVLVLSVDMSVYIYCLWLKSQTFGKSGPKFEFFLKIYPIFLQIPNISRTGQIYIRKYSEIDKK